MEEATTRLTSSWVPQRWAPCLGVKSDVAILATSVTPALTLTVLPTQSVRKVPEGGPRGWAGGSRPLSGQ